MHEQFEIKLEGRNTIQEKTNELEDHGEYFDVVQEINWHG